MFASLMSCGGTLRSSGIFPLPVALGFRALYLHRFGIGWTFGVWSRCKALDFPAQALPDSRYHQLPELGVQSFGFTVDGLGCRLQV